MCGDVISAQKLNNIEDGIEEALEGGGGCENTVQVNIPTDAIRLDTNQYELSNTEELTINANSTVQFVGGVSGESSQTTLPHPMPIVGFDSGSDALIITSAVWVRSGFFGGYTIKVRNVSDSNVTIAKNTCKVLYAGVLSAHNSTYTLCGQMGGDDPIT